MAAEECPDPDYNKSIDYILKLHNHLGSVGQPQVEWIFSTEGPDDSPKHCATAKLNGTTIGFGRWNTKKLAKKVAAFHALKYLRQI